MRLTRKCVQPAMWGALTSHSIHAHHWTSDWNSWLSRT